MKRILFAACVLSLAFAGVGNAQGTASSPETDTQLTKAELKQLATNAHAPAQYTALASYFGKRRDNYLQKAVDEKKEWARRSPMGHGPGRQVPKACGLGTKSLRVLHVQGLQAYARSEVQSHGVAGYPCDAIVSRQSPV